MKRVLIPVLSVMMLASTAFAAGHDGARGERAGFETKVEFLAKKLDLSEEQQVQIKALQQEYRPEKQDMRAKMKAMHESLQALDVEAADYDQQLNQLAESAAVEAAQQAKNRILLMGKIKAVLTQEQREEFAQLMDKRGERKRDKDHH